MTQTHCPGCRELQQRVTQLEAQVQQLTEQLEQAQRAAKRQAAPFRKRPPQANPKRPGRKAGEEHGTHGHRPPPPPEAIHEVLDAPLPDACPECGGDIVETHVAHQYQTEIPRRPIHRQFNIHLGQCGSCGQKLQGRHPLQTSDALGAAASQLGPDAQAAVATLNKEAGLSHGKVAACLHTLFGIDLTRGASAQIVLRAAKRLEPTYQEIRDATKQAEVLSIDETGWRIGGQPAWLHVWVGEQSTCYAIDPHRSAAVLEQVIGRDWEGVLIHDGFASYDRFDQAIHQQCLFHVLRRAQNLAAAVRGRAACFPREVIALFTEAIGQQHAYHDGACSAKALAASRDGFEERLVRLLNVRRAVPASERLAEHLYRHFSSWFAFLTDPFLPATNWMAEQAIRPAVVNRKVWGGNRTPAGARAQSIVMSVLATCRQQARVGLDFVSQTLRAFGNRLLSRPTLLPAR